MTGWFPSFTTLCLCFVAQCFGLGHHFQQSERRHVLSFLGIGGFVITPIPHLENARAATPANPAEAVRRSAARIPGYGQTDVFYPQVFQGNWKATRDILPTSSERSTGTTSGLTLEYSVRFLPSIEDIAVVADRGWNQANLEKAIRQLATKTEKDDASLMPSYEWTETNPNDLRLTFADGSRKEIKVTKRATEKTDETVFSSEFQRVTQEDPSRGIPVITARRVLSKWKVIDHTTIEGIEVVYDVSSMGDPLSGSTEAFEQNKVLSKSRLRLERLP